MWGAIYTRPIWDSWDIHSQHSLTCSVVRLPSFPRSPQPLFLEFDDLQTHITDCLSRLRLLLYKWDCTECLLYRHISSWVASFAFVLSVVLLYGRVMRSGRRYFVIYCVGKGGQFSPSTFGASVLLCVTLGIIKLAFDMALLRSNTFGLM